MLAADAAGASGREPFGEKWERDYLGHYLTAGPSRFHEDLYADLADLHARRGTRLNYRGPRGSAKTTHISKAYPLWCVCEQAEPFILLLAETGEQARLYLKAIKDELATNPKLAARYPAACGEGPTWRNDAIETRNGVCIVARGSGGRVLGLTHRNRRPTLVVGDDLNQRADAYSPTLRRRKLDWFEKDVLKVGEPGTNYLTAGTSIHRQAIVCELSRNPAWSTRRYAAVLRWPDRLDLWAECERRLSNLADPDRLATARAFYEANRADMDAGAELLWPDRFPLFDLMAERAADGPAAFASERQDEPGADGATEFPAEYFDWPGLWFEDWPADVVCKAQTLDPSKGAASKPGDYQAHARGAVGRDGTIYVECDMRREPVTDMVGRAIDWAASWGVGELAVEENGTMGLIGPEFARQLAERRKMVNLVAFTSTDPKLARIRRAGGYLSRRQIRVRNTPGGRLLVDQWRDVPAGEFDDGPDAVGSLIARLERMVNGGR